MGSSGSNFDQEWQAFDIAKLCWKKRPFMAHSSLGLEKPVSNFQLFQLKKTELKSITQKTKRVHSAV